MPRALLGKNILLSQKERRTLRNDYMVRILFLSGEKVPFLFGLL